MGLNILHWIGAFLYFAAMVLLVIASVSSPIWDNVGYVKGQLNGQHFVGGNWGYCFGGVCTPSSLGYDQQRLAQLTGTSAAASAIRYTFSKTLVLAPVSAGLAFIALLFSLSTHFVMGILASLWGFLAFLSTIVLLGLSLGFFISLRNRLNRDVPNTDISISVVVWLIVAAAGALLFGMLFVCFTRNRKNKRERKSATYANDNDYPVMRSTTAAETPMVGSEAHYSGAASNPDSHDPLVANGANRTSYAPTTTGTTTNYGNTGATNYGNAGTTTYGNAGTLGTDPTYGAGVGSTYDHTATEPVPTGPTTASSTGHWWQRQETARV
ncbi:pali-domain-containing protein [Rhodotorula sp. JG-1b]|nr:pali-domain-containing protein [Rhodotorula sp. JG-1b]